MRTSLGQFILLAAYALSATGCTSSRWVTEPDTSRIAEETATSVKPTITIVEHPHDKPQLVLKLEKQLTGPIVKEERRHEIVHTVWGGSVGNMVLGLLCLTVSPLHLVAHTLSGHPSEGLAFMFNSASMALGFNVTPEGKPDIPDTHVNFRVQETSEGLGTLTVPWGNGFIDLASDGMPSIRKRADDSGIITINLKSLPIDTNHPTKPLILVASAEAGGSIDDKRVTVPVATMLAWPGKEAESSRKERERRSRAEREAEERKEDERVRRAEEKAEADANLNLMIQSVGVITSTLAAQQHQTAVPNSSLSTTQSTTAPSMAMQSVTQTPQVYSPPSGFNGSGSAGHGDQSDSSNINASSRYRHNPAHEANQCIAIDKSKKLYGAEFVNTCSFTVGVHWCANTSKDLSNCNRGYDSYLKLLPGASAPIDPLDKAVSWEYVACKGDTMYFTSDMSKRKETKCLDR